MRLIIEKVVVVWFQIWDKQDENVSMYEHRPWSIQKSHMIIKNWILNKVSTFIYWCTIKKKKKHPSTFLSNLKIKQLFFYKDYQQKWDLINEMCYVHNIFITNHSYLVVIDSNFNLTLRLLLCFNNNNQ